jgi:glutathione S-transferase
MITFYYGSGSPFAWRVWLALEHKQVTYELRLLSFAQGDLMKEEFRQLNPRHKVPVIVEDGFSLYESVAIVEYLDERFPETGHGSLFPGDAHDRAVVRRLVQEVDHYFARAVEPLVGQILFSVEGQRDENVIAAGRAGLLAELDAFERHMRGEFLVGRVSAADFALYPWIGIVLRLDLRRPDLALRAAIGPKLTAWMKHVEGLPYFEKTYPPHWRT